MLRLYHGALLNEMMIPMSRWPLALHYLFNERAHGENDWLDICLAIGTPDVLHDVFV